MLEYGPVKVTEERDHNLFEPVLPTRLNDQLIGILSLVSQGCTQQEILDTLHMKELTMKGLYRKIPSLPKPKDFNLEL